MNGKTMAADNVKSIEYKNAVYFFVPMSYKDPELMYEPLHDAVLSGREGEDPHWKALDRGPEWSGKLRQYKNDRYLLRYIASRFHGREPVEDEYGNQVKEDQNGVEENKYFYKGNHFLLNDQEAILRKFDLPQPGQRCVLKTKRPGDPGEGTEFYMGDVQLFTFDTGVFILAFCLKMEDGSTRAVQNAVFQIKNVSRNRIVYENETAERALLDIAKTIGKDIYDRAAERQPEYKGKHFRYFYYQKEGRERANVLTYLQQEYPFESEEDERLINCGQCRRDLFFLRNGFSEDYTFYEDLQEGEAEIYVHSNRAIWGTTQEAAVCLSYPEASGERAFIKHEFFNNLNTSYLLMYVLLLHQKYALYLFLRNIGDKEHEDSKEELRAYRDRLYRFESGYVFSHVSEVPQYQGLYEKMYRNMKLGEMYQDVREPLIMLNTLETEADQKAQEEQNMRLTIAMAMLSFLIVISAFTDGFDLIDNFLGIGEWGCGHWIGRIIISVIVIGVIVTGLNIMNVRGMVAERMRAKWKKKK